MTQEEYDRSQEAERLDTRRGLNDNAYAAWVYDMSHPAWKPTPGEFVEQPLEAPVPASWLPRPVPWWEGDGEAPPTLLARQDGPALLYAGKINAIIGPSEQGKSWLALLACFQAFRLGLEVTYVDFESDGPSIGGRLMQMGLTQRELHRLHYVQPDERYRPGARVFSDLVIVDGLNTWLGLHGVDYNSSTDVTTFAKLNLFPWAAEGAGVVLLDHTPKNPQPGAAGGPIGSQAKKSIITGCMLQMKMTESFGRKRVGKATIYVEKDRPGYVRGMQMDDKSVAQLVVDDTNGTAVRLTTSPWVAKDASRQDREVTEAAAVRKALQGGPLSRLALALALGHNPNDSAHKRIVERLCLSGHITTWKDGRNLMHKWCDVEDE